MTYARPTRDDERLQETTVAERVVYQGKYLTFRVDTVRDADGGEHERELVLHPGAVAIVALDGDDVLLVRQWRHATGGALLEIPAGTIDPLADGSSEPPEVCAARELGEETGRQAARWRDLGALPGYAGPQPDERLDLVRMPWRDAVVAAERGEIHDAKSLVGLFQLARLAERGEL
jgi:ADP-ribose pyrophosphatase